MAEQKESKELAEVRALLATQSIPSSNAVEFYGTEEAIELLKETIRNETSGHCYFFTRAEEEDVHLIALLNIKNISELLENVKGFENLNKINFSNSQKSKFDPKGISFGG